MDDIKFETQCKLETLFISLTIDNINVLDDILNTPEVPILEKQLIRKYKVLVDNIHTIPSIETLKKEFPSLYFDEIIPIKSNQINDFISMFIANRKNLYTSDKLLQISSTIKNEGMTETVLNELNNLTKVDTVKKDFEDVVDKIEEIYKDKDTSIGFKTGVPQIDELTGGLKLGTLNTILGFTGSFKTTWAANMAYSTMKDGYNVLYLSLEVPKEILLFNVLSRHSYDEKFDMSIPKDKIIARKLKPDQEKYLSEKVIPDYRNLKGKCYFIDENDLESYTTFALENLFRTIDKKAMEDTNQGISMVIIDHAQLLKFSTNTNLIGRETSVINNYVSFFRKNAINWIRENRKVCMVMLSQASREGWKDAKRNDGVYKLTALAEANELERASAVIASVYADDSLTNMNTIKVSLLKNRNGRTSSDPIETFIDPEYYVFGNVKGSGNANIADFSNLSLSSLLNADQDDVQELSSFVPGPDLSNIDIGL